jgi:exosome complex exonuclease DIS3/RRP44
VTEVEDRRFYYFYNENFEGTAIKDERRQFAGLGLDARLTRKVLKVFEWYTSHFAALTSEKKVFLLTTDAAQKSVYQKLLASKSTETDQIIDVNDFVLQHQAKFPELENYLGFTGTEAVDHVTMNADEGEAQQKT